MLDRPTATAAALARLYDLDLVDDPGDLDLYLALAERTGGPILELAVGHRPAGRPAGRGRPPGHRRRPRPGDARPRAAPRRGRPGRTRRPADARRGRPRRPAPARRRARIGLAFIALNSLLVLRDARRPAGRPADAWPPTSPRAALAVVDVWLPDAEDLARFDGRIILEWPRTRPGDRRRS